MAENKEEEVETSQHPESLLHKLLVRLIQQMEGVYCILSMYLSCTFLTGIVINHELKLKATHIICVHYDCQLFIK